MTYHNNVVATLYCFISTMGFLLFHIFGIYLFYVTLQFVLTVFLLLFIMRCVTVVGLFFIVPAVLFCYTFSGYIDYLFFKEYVKYIYFEYALLVYLSSLFIGSFVFFARRGVRGKILIDVSSQKFFVIALIIAVCFSLYFIEAIQLLSSTYGSRRELLESRSYEISILKLIFPSLLALYFVLNPEGVSGKFKRKTAIAAIIIFVFFEIFIFGNRRMAAGLLIFVLVANNYKLSFGKMVVVALSFVFLYIYQFLRAYSFSDWAGVLSSGSFGLLNPMKTELAVFYDVGVDVLKSGGREIFGCTYCDVPAILISTFIPNDVLTPAETYVKSFHPDIWANGGGRAYSFILETYQNLWLLGPLVAGFLAGRLVSYSESRVSAIAVGSLILLYCNFLFFPRLSLIAALKPALPTLLILLFFFLIPKIIGLTPIYSKKNRKWSSP